MPTERDIAIAQANIDALKALTDQQVLMLALAELIMNLDNIPPGKRISLHAELTRRAGAR